MFEVAVTDRFTAAHRLQLADGTLESLHSHDWRASLTYAGSQLDRVGVLVDFTDIKLRLGRTLADFRGRTLNELPAFSDRNPSAENVARYIATQLADGLPTGVRLQCVEIEEEPGCVARYFPTPPPEYGRDP